MKTRSWILTAAATLAAVALLGWAFVPAPLEVEAATARAGPFTTTLDEDGKTRLRDRFVVSAPLGGRLDRIRLREGDTVEADEVLATLTPLLPPLLDDRTLREQQLRVEVAQAQVARAQSRIERAKVALLQQQSDARRSEQLATQGFVSPTKLEADRLAVLAAQREIETATQERHVAAHEVEQARAALVAVQRSGHGSGAAFVLRAPVRGRVLRIVRESEGVVALGTPLVEIGDTHALEIVAELLTTDAMRAKPGSPVIIERWGGDGVLQGRVRQVEPGAFTKISALGVEEQRVKVLIDIVSPSSRWAGLGDGYRVGVRIVTLAVDDALQVPVGAVFPVRAGGDGGEAGGAMATFAIVDGRARLTPVEVRARNGAQAWVAKGLKAGDAVIVYPPSALRDGARVRIRTV